MQAVVAGQLRDGTRPTMIAPDAAATGSPSSVARTSTPSPTRMMRGARMKTPGSGSVSPASATGASNERTWRP